MSQGNWDNSNRGALFKNDDKQQENHPDYKGSINVAEDDYWISAWLKTSKEGRKYMSLSVTPKQQQRQKPVVKSQPVEEDFGDNIPFAFAFLSPAALAFASIVYFAPSVVA